ncbi:MAG: T9SS type A sorting domain-containing protein [Bacteroidia bacterium]|nr:T9SS type A sorting domain-containing protein [Bacteroidia bacterium]
MNKKLLLLAALLFSFTLNFAQMSILLVDDSDDSFGHVETFADALDSLGYAYSTYDASGTQSIPSGTMLQSYDLVIWHTGSDGDSLSLWDLTDTTNFPLESYLSLGGRLWLIGTDFLYDRYGGAPDTFSTGDFPYDYLGVSSYDVQSYIDDGSLGLPVADPASGSPISGLNQLDWIFSTLWYVDGVTPVNGAQIVYEMGDNSYVLSGYPCGLWYDNGTSQVLSFYFNVSQISTFDKMKTMTGTVLEFFQSQLTGRENLVVRDNDLVLFPNPTNGNVNLKFTAETGGNAMVQVFSTLGQEVYTREISVNSGTQVVNLPSLDLQSGLYVVQLSLNGQKMQQTLIRK